MTNRKTSTPSTLSGAQENKSYGYHDGFCTNSCKCEVDVIIRNIDANDIAQQNEELERILKGQQQQQEYLNSKNSICTDTTVQIKDCNCKIKEQQQPQQNNKNCNQFGAAIENKAYFSLFTPSKNSIENYIKYHHLTESSKSLLHGCHGIDDDNEDSDGKSHFTRVPLSQGDLLNIARQVAVGMVSYFILL